MAKKNLPHIPIYIGDWDKDCNCLSLEAEMAWMKIIFKMFTNGKVSTYKIPTKSLQILWKSSAEKVSEIIEELQYNDITNIKTTDERIEFVCRRYKKENDLSKIRSEAVSSRYKDTKPIQKPIQKSYKKLHNADNDNDNDNDNDIDNDIEYDNEIYKWWNEKKIITHHKLTDKIKTKIKTTLKDYSIEQIKTAITNYSIIVNDEQYYFKYKWVLKDFLQRGLDQFMDLDIAKSNYKSNAINTKERKHDVSNDEYKNE